MVRLASAPTGALLTGVRPIVSVARLLVSTPLLAVPPLSRAVNVKLGSVELLLALAAGVKRSWPLLMLVAVMTEPLMTGAPALVSVPPLRLSVPIVTDRSVFGSLRLLLGGR